MLTWGSCEEEKPGAIPLVVERRADVDAEDDDDDGAVFVDDRWDDDEGTFGAWAWIVAWMTRSFLFHVVYLMIAAVMS